MADLPPAPDDLDEDEQEVWRRGFAACAHLLSGHTRTLAAEMDPAMETVAETDEADESDEETCENCGAELIEGFGGAICPDGCEPDGS